MVVHFYMTLTVQTFMACPACFFFFFTQYTGLAEVQITVRVIRHKINLVQLTRCKFKELSVSELLRFSLGGAETERQCESTLVQTNVCA